MGLDERGNRRADAVGQLALEPAKAGHIKVSIFLFESKAVTIVRFHFHPLFDQKTL